jgi:hypothetical protein
MPSAGRLPATTPGLDRVPILTFIRPALPAAITHTPPLSWGDPQRLEPADRRSKPWQSLVSGTLGETITVGMVYRTTGAIGSTCTFSSRQPAERRHRRALNPGAPPARGGAPSRSRMFLPQEANARTARSRPPSPGRRGRIGAIDLALVMVVVTLLGITYLFQADTENQIAANSVILTGARGRGRRPHGQELVRRAITGTIARRAIATNTPIFAKHSTPRSG